MYNDLFCILMLSGCEQISQRISLSTQLTEEQSIDADMLYRGLMYGNLEQIQKHTAPELYKSFEASPEFIKETKQLLPKKDYLDKSIFSVASQSSILPYHKKQLEVTYHYTYDDKLIVYSMFFDKDMHEIIGTKLSKAVLFRRNTHHTFSF